MTEPFYEASYTPTQVEIRRALIILNRTIFAGSWRVAYLASSVWRGASYAVAGFVSAALLMGAFGIRLEGQTMLYYGLAIFIAVLPLALQRAVANRYVQAYLTAPILQGQRIRLDQTGVTLDNGRSQSHLDWRDVSQVVAGPRMLVAAQGNTCLVLPDRLFAAQGGDTGGLREQVQAWYLAARGGPT